MDNPAKKTQTWFITGASKGFGLEIVQQLLHAGHQVAATSRDLNELRQAVGSKSDKFLPLAVDLTTEARENFDVNVFGTLNVIRHVMPQLRRQGSGHIFNFSSIAGILGGFPGWGVYCATKFAVEGLSEALAAEVAPFGIRVTVVAPGYFRTNFLKPGPLKLANEKLPEYKIVRDNETYHDQLQEANGQLGDPAKAAAAIIAVATAPNAPLHLHLHLLLGEDAYRMADTKIKNLQADMAQWQALAIATAAEPDHA